MSLSLLRFKDGESISEEDAYEDGRIHISQLNSTLIINEATEEDVGMYTCKSKMDPMKQKNISVVSK